MNYDIYQAKTNNWIIIADAQNIIGVYPKTHRLYENMRNNFHHKSTRLTNQAMAQLDEYFNHKRCDFSLPLATKGTDFQQKIWAELCNIQHATTINYAEIAKRVGAVNAARACGKAIGANPISIIIPCHRVVGKSGKLTGYAGGVDVKAELLNHEQFVAISKVI
jgi:methylated-DNA-[protein]-cysteine S-methyltransferase